MFKKILIANRGEIACRVIKTARKMGITTVAVYADADKNAPHVQMADETVHIGASPAAQSYLIIDKILDAVQKTGAEAVHPGYGFLSENAKFAEALAAANVAFIGPPVNAIEAMGDKITSKKIAMAAGVSTVPGVMALVDDPNEAAKIASDIGYPVMIKASAGGGGKGMRIAWNDDEAREGFQSSKNEAAASFGDDRIFIEKFVQNPRHIEIQVLGDKHGNVVYLGERECSIQRRNQKVIEEAPSPFLDEATRRQMGEQAVALSQNVNYHSAGTVEFIVDPEKNFYFLEMNTRLQVEHPVTELITGLDLVEQMIRVAAGEALTFAQDDIKLTGWAMESRLYAEDPYRGFLPSIGRLTRYRPPEEGVDQTGALIRNDTGVEEGGEISMFYDPMIAKLCTWAPGEGMAARTAAIDKMQSALDEFEVEGIGHNIPFLQAVYAHDRFRSGNISTAFIEQEYPDGFEGAALEDADKASLAAMAAAMQAKTEARAAQISGRLFPAANDSPPAYAVKVGADLFENVAAQPDALDWLPGRTIAHMGGTTAFVKPHADGWLLEHRGARAKVTARRPKAQALAELMPEKLPPDTSKLLLCPMPGLVVSIAVAEGDEIQEGQALATVEAMKMENILRAERKGVVSKVNAAAGDNLAVDDVIMEFA